MPEPVTPATPTTSRRALTSSWPSVGRDDERSLGVLRCTEGPGLALYGEPGVGKTHLATRIIEQVLAEPDRDLAHVPLAATEARRHIPLSTLEPLLGTLEPSDRPRARGLGAVIGDRLQALAGDRPILVHVEDAHLLDDASADGLASLCRMGRIRLLTTVRTGVTVPASLTALWKDEVVERIDVQPFTVEEVERVLTAALGGEVVRQTAWELWSATNGNAFHLREVVRDGLDGGDLVADDGIWAWQGSPQPGRRFAELVTVELAQLSRSERDVVDLVALAEPIPVRVIVDQVDGSALDAVIDRGLVTVDRPPDEQRGGAVTARLLHPLYAESVRDLVGPERRRRLFQAVVDGLESDPSHTTESLPRLLRSVAWALECGITPPVDRLLHAAQAAAVLAHDHYPIRIATVALDHLPDDDPRRIDALVIRAQTWRFRGDLARARRDLEAAATAVDRQQSPDHGDRNLTVAIARADLAQYHDDDVDRALALVDEATPRSADAVGDRSGPEAGAVLAAHRLARLGWAGRFHESTDAGLALLQSDGLPASSRLPLVTPVILGLTAQGRFDEAHRLGQTALSDARAHPDAAPWSVAEIEAGLFTLLLSAGRIDQITGLYAGASDSEDELLRFNRTVQQIGTGQLAAAEARWEDAYGDFRAAVSAFRTADHSGYLAIALAHLARAAVATGRRVEAQQAIASFQEVPLRSSRVVAGQLQLVICAARLGLADTGVATDLLALADRAGRRGEHLIELSALHLLATHTTGTADDGRSSTQLLARVRALEPTVGDPIGPLLVQHARAVLTGEPVLETALAGALTQIGVWLPPIATSVRLSRRQREVADLAATGLTSRAIADRLHVSVRTVDTHLAAVFTKLGINRRTDLPEALRHSNA